MNSSSSSEDTIQFSINETSPSSTPSTSSSFLSQWMPTNMDWKRWIFVILILSFFGFNVFFYLAEGTQTITNILKPLTGFVLGIIKMITNSFAQVTESGVNLTAKTLDTGLEEVQTLTGDGPNSIPIPDYQSLGKTSIGGQGQGPSSGSSSSPPPPPSTGQGSSPPPPSSYEADDSMSVIQSSKGASKSGWCFVGEERGFRSCVEIGDNDKCMSGDIFPTKDVCVNPNLRH